MKINDILFNCTLSDILTELVSQLRVNEIDLIAKQKNGPTHIQITCPYHSGGHERNPSAGIRKEDGLFHCFACGEVHTLPEVISYCFGYTDDITGKFGMQWLLKNFASLKVEERKDVELDFSRDKKAPNNNRVVNRINNYISDEELDKYRYTHPYMYKRGLTDEVITMFDIGYDRDMQAITFPVRDIRGNCLFIARRSIKTKFFNYPEGVEKPLYGLYELYKKYPPFLTDVYGEKPRSHPTEVIVTESMLDALSFWTVEKDAVALNGLGNELQFQQLRQLPCREIILATDMDERGLAARERIRKNLNGTKLIAEYFFPEGRKDANDCTKEELRNLVGIY